MEETMKWEQTSLISELIQGKELAKQLCDHLSSASSYSSSSHESNEGLIEKILFSYEKALTMLNWGPNEVGDTKNSNSNYSITIGSPRSEVVDPKFKHKDVSKKRKPMPKWTEQVKVCPGTPLEGSLNDGYSWRKYGQKDILGARFPRGYYRCTHKSVQGCLATKQVQKSDQDPTIIEITYKGRHTCTQANNLKEAFPSKTKMGLIENHQLHNPQKDQPQQDKRVEQPIKEANFTFGAGGLEVETEELNTKEEIFPSLSFHSPSIGSENEDNNMFNEIMMENIFMENFCPTFLSPTASESNIFCLSPCQLGSTGPCQNVQTSESDINDIVSAPTSVTNSPVVNLDIILDKVDFDMDFPFNTPELFSS